MANNVISLFERRNKSSTATTTPLELAEQLTLPFFAPQTLLFSHTSIFRESDSFVRFLKINSTPKIFDMRIAPRLDFIRPTRAQAFALFENLSIEYRDMLGWADVNSYVENDEIYMPVWQSMLSEIEFDEIPSQSALVIFDDVIFLERSVKALKNSFAIINLDASCTTPKQANWPLEPNQDTELLRM